MRIYTCQGDRSACSIFNFTHLFISHVYHDTLQYFFSPKACFSHSTVQSSHISNESFVNRGSTSPPAQWPSFTTHGHNHHLCSSFTHMQTPRNLLPSDLARSFSTHAFTKNPRLATKFDARHGVSLGADMVGQCVAREW